MTEWFRLYTDKRIDCKWCQMARESLQVWGKDYYEIDMSEPGSKELFLEKGLRTVPQVWLEDQYIGNYNQLKEWLEVEQKQKERDFRRRRKPADEVGE